jgi:hypothetical protein
LTTVGDGTKDNHFGYCYLPLIFVKSGTMYTTASYTIHGYNKELQGEIEKPDDPKFAPFGHNLGYHPFFATREEAVKWLKDRGLYGEVLRYAHHKPLKDRVPTWEYEGVLREYRWKQYHPWLTAGVTDIVAQESNVVPSSPLGLAAGFELHNPDGSHRHVGGNEKVLEAVFAASEEISELD